jgi:hypothetical protein
LILPSDQSTTNLLVRPGDQKETGFKLLQEDNTLSAETTGKEDEDGTGSDAGAEGGLAGSLTRKTGTRDILGGVVFGSLRGRHQTLLSVGLSTNSLLGVSRGLGFGGSSRSLLA